MVQRRRFNSLVFGLVLLLGWSVAGAQKARQSTPVTPQDYVKLVTELYITNSEVAIKAAKQLGKIPRNELDKQLRAVVASYRTSKPEVSDYAIFARAYFGFDYEANLKQILTWIGSDRDAGRDAAEALFRLYQKRPDRRILVYLFETRSDGVWAEGLSMTREEVFFTPELTKPMLEVLARSPKGVANLGINLGVRDDVAFVNKRFEELRKRKTNTKVERETIARLKRAVEAKRKEDREYRENSARESGQ